MENKKPFDFFIHDKYYGTGLKLHVNLYPHKLRLCLKIENHLINEVVFIDYKDVCELSAELIKIKKEMKKHLNNS